ncbi:FtsK/SpoIIIE domain-containing protein [Mobiluncus mulieris]|uniref:FtsK/SpoIIIE domain-containing protein n=1 Tax=Mobiluncus mulieris TaxID=2052 RepID=UPI00146FDF46|nr:FtsK/SpoIIIE domain-containing protein [Mobiluncus mulieris]NMX12591.1 type IV secretion system DNA-binding domain-containing protein [Mobiluncus mulieris]
MKEIDFAVRATGEVVTISPLSHIMVTGNTGSGKTTAVQAFMAGYSAMGAEAQAIILDPKLVSWRTASPRFHVLTKPEEWLQALVAVNDEIERRFMSMANSGAEVYEVTEENPFLLIVVEEAPAIIGSSSMLIKREADEARAQLARIVRMGRQSGVSVCVLSQTGYTESVPSAIRSNLTQRIVLRAGSEEEAAAASGRPAEEVRATMLIPGESFSLTDTTRQRYVRCRAYSPKQINFAQTMQDHASYKQRLAFLEERNL